MKLDKKTMDRVRVAQVARAKTGLPLVEVEPSGKAVIKVAADGGGVQIVPLSALPVYPSRRERRARARAMTKVLARS